jgi:hypothetical protein
VGEMALSFGPECKTIAGALSAYSRPLEELSLKIAGQALLILQAL